MADKVDVVILETFHRFVPDGKGGEVREDYFKDTGHSVDAETAKLWIEEKKLARRKATAAEPSGEPAAT
ncbi:hypothetical protein [Reyranella sp.]|uniref:hypothetical protein n=1 Tax=Reyranella sp. TaxID=1929291 RepID=UPI0027320753|nr:hypothetical protein [Reyranella sp.]MDP2377786.1 hypothetical protein [Reyranella sp.]